MRSSKQRRTGLALAVAAFVGGAAGCSEDVSYIVVTPEPGDGEAPLELIEQYRVLVDNGGEQTVLLYPKTPTAPFTIGPGPGPNFSVSVPESRTGALTVWVFPRKTGGAEIAWGSAQIPIVAGGVARVTVKLYLGTPPGDGGVGDGGQDKADAPGDARTDATDAGDGGTDGAKTCFPSRPADCGPGMTCYLDCMKGSGLCTAAGSNPAGATCKGTNECEPGTSCFEFDACAVTSCVHYCDVDADCPGGGKCIGDLTCGGSKTLGKLCTFPCDPRLAGDAKIGCPSGLICNVYANETPDCACQAATQTGGDGDACANNLDCKPGFHCIDMDGPKTCRQICKLGDGTDCPSPLTCTMLTNYKTFGACQ